MSTHEFDPVHGHCRLCGTHFCDAPVSTCVKPKAHDLVQENKKLNDFSQGLVAINLSLNDQVSQLREELAQYKTEIEQLREIAENERLKANEENHIRFQRELQAKCVATQEVVDSLRAEIKELRENQISISHMQRSNAWGEVHSVLTEVAPDWNKGKDSGTNLACATIRKLADDAKKFRSLELANVVTTSFEDQKLKVTLAFETIPREVNIYTEIVKP